MCLHQKRSCSCGAEDAYFFHRDNILPEEVLVGFYCPKCRDRLEFDASSMVEDAGWIIEYDMEAARFYLRTRGYAGSITPEAIFDKDYCSWYGLTPMDLEENARLQEELKHLKETDVLGYIASLKEKRLKHLEQLKKAGWRKALDT